jgi:hypothetical protein
MTDPNRPEEATPEPPEVAGPGAEVGPGGADLNADEEGRASGLEDGPPDDPGVGDAL